MFPKKSILTLDDDNEYAIINQFINGGITYIYLVDINNNSNVIYGKVINDEIVQITDPIELEKIIKLVYSNLHK